MLSAIVVDNMYDPSEPRQWVDQTIVFAGQRTRLYTAVPILLTEIRAFFSFGICRFAMFTLP